MDKILTISVAAYNSEGWLSRCLDSFIINEVMDKLEVIVVNDGSTDGTHDIASDYCGRYPDLFRLIDKENGGHGSTINTSLKAANGKYYKLVDSDDWVEKDGLIKLVHALEKTDADLVLNPFYEVGTDPVSKKMCTCLEKSRYNGIVPGEAVPLSKVADGIDLLMHGMTYRTDRLKKNNVKIDEHCLYVDTEFTVLNFFGVSNVLILEEPVYDYLNGTEVQSMNMKNVFRHIDEMMKVMIRLEKAYTDRLDKNDEANSRVIYRLLSIKVPGTYRYILSMDDKKLSRRKLISFDRVQMNRYRSLYDAMLKDGCRTYKLLSVMRMMRFRFYGMFTAIVRLHNKKKYGA